MAAIISSHHWKIRSIPETEVTALARQLNTSHIIATLLYQRGCRTPTAAEEFLNPSPLRLHKPDTLPDISIATRRIQQAIEKEEKILVYGDYDVDGVCGTAILVSTIKNLGGRVLAYIPHRHKEGYGFSPAGVEFAREQHVQLIITTDCGSSDLVTITRAQQSGMDVIVTDHHEPGPHPSPAVAFINPKRPDSHYPFRELAGAGVAFKLAWQLLATLGRTKQELIELLDLAGLGTIADVVPLIGENRVIARLGLLALNRTTRPGIRALIESSGLKPGALTARDIGFILGPRINAAGRVDHAQPALELLLTSDETSAKTIAEELNQLNRVRQALEEKILNQAIQRIETENLAKQRVIVLEHDGWHEGVIGIVAARLVERFWRPCIMIALKEKIGKGSGRSVTGFDLYSSLQACAQHLLSYGGHRYAAGLKISKENIPQFRTAINQFALNAPEEIFAPTLHIETVASLNEINEELLVTLAKFEPFGPENPEPVFASLGLEVVGYPRRVGRDKQHLKFKVRSGESVLTAIAWERSNELLNIQVGKPNHIDICYTIGADNFRGNNGIQLNILDLKTHREPNT